MVSDPCDYEGGERRGMPSRSSVRVSEALGAREGIMLGASDGLLLGAREGEALGTDQRSMSSLRSLDRCQQTVQSVRFSPR